MEDINKKRLNSYGLLTKRNILKLIDEGNRISEISRIKNIPVSYISRYVSNSNNLENPLYSSN